MATTTIRDDPTHLDRESGRHHRPGLVAAMAALIAAGLACGPGQPAPAPPPPDFSDVDAAVGRLIDGGGLAGAVVAIVHGDTLAHLETYGAMDLASQAPMRADAIFRIYSMTKPITTTAALMLVDEGKLTLDDPVAEHIPVLAGLQVYGPEGNHEPARPMTVRDLMRHTTGFTYGMFGDTPVDALYAEAQPLAAANLEEMMNRLAHLPLLCDPGSCWNYGVSTDVLGRVVEVISGQPLDAFFQARIFEPLGMVDSGFWVPEEKLDRVATLYEHGEEGLKVLEGPLMTDPGTRPGVLSGGGGLYSTAADYVRFLRMIARGGELEGVRLLQAGTVAEMTRNQLPEDLVPIAVTDPMPGTGFGLGFAVRVAESDTATASAVGDYGWDGLASTHAWVSPAHDLIVVTLEQTMPFSSATADAVRPAAYAAVSTAAAATR
jgi:CubicO group peptidase (beta-lactamase class C family)